MKINTATHSRGGYSHDYSTKGIQSQALPKACLEPMYLCFEVRDLQLRSFTAAAGLALFYAAALRAAAVVVVRFGPA